MVQIPNKVILLIKQFISDLNDNNIVISRAILFGSYAHGAYNEWSDIDIALVSDDFIGDRFADRNIIRKIKLSVSSDLEPIPYTTKSFSSDDPFVKNILETGIAITL